jgi:hypothetical protein
LLRQPHREVQEAAEFSGIRKRVSPRTTAAAEWRALETYPPVSFGDLADVDGKHLAASVFLRTLRHAVIAEQDRPE